MSVKKFLNTYPQFEQLDGHSLDVAVLFEKAYPQWMGYAAIESFQQHEYFCVRVPAPVDPTDRDLIFYTDRDDITVDFHHYHAHFGRSRPRLSLSQCFENARKFIEDFRQEKLFVAVDVKGIYPLSYSCTPEALESLLNREKITYTRSWLGTYNKSYGD